MSRVKEEKPELWDRASEIYDEYSKRNGYSNFVRRWIGQHVGELQGLADCRVLDLGCGTGICVKVLREHGLGGLAEGVDGSPEMLVRARATGWYERLYTRNLDSPLPEIPTDTFDLVMAFGFLEFLNDAYVCISECRRVLKRDGTLWATFKRFEAEDVGSPPRMMSLPGLTSRGYSAGEILYLMSELEMRVISLEPTVGYITPNGFSCQYYVLSARKTR